MGRGTRGAVHCECKPVPHRTPKPCPEPSPQPSPQTASQTPSDLSEASTVQDPTAQSYTTRTYWFFRDKRTVCAQTAPWGVKPEADEGEARVRFERGQHTVTGEHVWLTQYEPPPFQPDVLRDGWTPMNLFSGLAGVMARVRSGLGRGAVRLTTVHTVKERAQSTQYDAGDCRDSTQDTRQAGDLDTLVVLRADADVGARGAAGGADAGAEGGAVATGGVEPPLCDCIPLGDGDGWLRGPRCQIHAEYISTQGPAAGGGSAGGSRAARLVAAKRARGAKARAVPAGAKGAAGAKGGGATGGAQEGKVKKNKAVGVRMRKKKVKVTKQTVQTARPTPLKNVVAAVFKGLALLRTLRKFLTDEAEPSTNYTCYAKSQDPTGLRCWPCALPAAPCDCYTDDYGEQIKTCDLKSLDPLMAQLLNKNRKRKPKKTITKVQESKTHHVQFSSEVIEKSIPNEKAVSLNNSTGLFKSDATWGQDIQVRAATAVGGGPKVAVKGKAAARRGDTMGPAALGIAGLAGRDGAVGVTRNQAALLQPDQQPAPCDDRCHVCMPSEGSTNKPKSKGAFATPLYSDAPGEVGAPIAECTCEPCPTENVANAAKHKMKKLGAMGGGTSRARHGEGARGLAEAQARAEAEGGGAGDEMPGGEGEEGKDTAETCAWKTGGVGAVCQPCREQKPCECTDSAGFEWKAGGCSEAEERLNNLRRKKKILLIKKKIVRKMFMKQLKENLGGNTKFGKCVICMFKKSTCCRKKKKRKEKRNKFFEKLEKDRKKALQKRKKAKAGAQLYPTKESKKTQGRGAKSDALDKHRKTKQKKRAKEYALEEKRRNTWYNHLKDRLVTGYKTALYVMSDDVERSDRRPLCRWLESTNARVYDCRNCVDVCTCQRLTVGARVGASCAKRVRAGPGLADDGPVVDAWPYPRLACGWADDTIKWPASKARKCKVCEAASAAHKPRPCDCKVVKGKITQGEFCKQKAPDEHYEYYRYPGGIPLDPLDGRSCLWNAREQGGRLCITCPLNWTDFKNEKYLAKLESDILEKLNDVEGKLKLKEEMYIENIVKHLEKDHRIPCKYYSKKDTKPTLRCTACKGEEVKKPEVKPKYIEGYTPPCYWERKIKSSAKCLVCDPEDEQNRKIAALNEYIAKKGRIKKSKIKKPSAKDMALPSGESTVMHFDTSYTDKDKPNASFGDRETGKIVPAVVNNNFSKWNKDFFAFTAIQQSKIITTKDDEKTELFSSAISKNNLSERINNTILMNAAASHRSEASGIASSTSVSAGPLHYEQGIVKSNAKDFFSKRTSESNIRIIDNSYCSVTSDAPTATLKGSKYQSNTNVIGDCARLLSKKCSNVIEFKNNTSGDLPLTKAHRPRRPEVGTDTTGLTNSQCSASKFGEGKFAGRTVNLGDGEGNPCNFKNYLRPAKTLGVYEVCEVRGAEGLRRAAGGHSLRTNG